MMYKVLILCLSFMYSIQAMDTDDSTFTRSASRYSNELTSSVDFTFSSDPTPPSSPRETVILEPSKEPNPFTRCLKKLFCCFCCWCFTNKEYQSILGQEHSTIIT